MEYLEILRSPGSIGDKGMNILLIEDHRDTALALTGMLSGMGHTVQTGNSVASALAAILANKFDVIVSDIGLPDGNGVRLISEIRRFCTTPAIAVTGYGMDDEIRLCLNAGFNSHLTKPVYQDQLKKAVDALDPSKTSTGAAS